MILFGPPACGEKKSQLSHDGEKKHTLFWGGIMSVALRPLCGFLPLGLSYTYLYLFYLHHTKPTKQEFKKHDFYGQVPGVRMHASYKLVKQPELT